MEKLVDEYDIEIEQRHKINAIVVCGVVDDLEGRIEHDDGDPAFFSVYRIEGGMTVCVGDFSDREDAVEFANRLCAKYGVKMLHNTECRGGARIAFPFDVAIVIAALCAVALILAWGMPW